MQTAIPIIIFILILGVVIFIHELGHFLAARRAGIFVEEFALGMGPKILYYQAKKKSEEEYTGQRLANADGTEPDENNGTLYSLRLFPVGGFCKLRGMEGDMPNDPEAINNKSIPARVLVMAGGSIMNFLLALVLFFGIVMHMGVPTGQTEVLVMYVTENSPAYRGGLRTGDIITHVNDIPAERSSTIIAHIESFGTRQLNLQIIRDGGVFTVMIHPERYLLEDGVRFTYRAGFVSSTRRLRRDARIHEGVTQSGQMMFEIARGPFELLSRFAQGEELAEGEAIVGPIGLGGLVTEAYEMTIQDGVGTMLLTMLNITAVISTALGVMNLLPLPALDGARIVFLLIEAVRKKPVPPEKEAIVHFVGLVALLILAVVIAYQDIVRLLPGGNEFTG